MAAIKVLFLAMVMALSTDGVFSCMCMTEHPQTNFCNSDYVLRGKIVSRTPVYGGMVPDLPTAIRYEVMPTNVYRATGANVQQGTVVTVTTSGYETTCAVTNMTVDEAYLISAKEISGQVVTTLCAWNSLFSKVTPSQRKMLRLQKYQTECTRIPSCEVRLHCGARDISMCQQFDGCTFRTTDCHVEHSYCTRENTSCRWRSFSKRHASCMSSQSSR